MKIQINDKYRIITDPTCVTLQEKVISSHRAKEEGKEYWRNTSYHYSLEQAYKRCITHGIMTSDLEDLREIVDCLEQLYNDIERSIRNEQGIKKT